jgi:type I restriction enzyme S subunit
VVELALRGRLTAQRADDEPTEDLLARIEEQRAALFERRRIGRGAGQQHHLEKEAPFAIPPSWRWTSLESLAGHIVDGTHHTPTYVSAGVPFISAKDIRGGRLRFDACRYIPRSEYDDLKKRCLPRLGNVLVSKSGSIGEVALVNTDREFTLFESVALVPVLPSVVASYVLLAVSHSAAGKFGQERQKGVGVRHLHLVDLRQLPVPLPPFAEQKRIVA